eukprot:5308595-Amphidinium_carterae.1
MKVYHFLRLLGPQLRDRPEEQPRVKLPAEPPAPPPAAPSRVPDADAPFQLGEHQRVVKHASFLQCLDCNRQAGRVKATGKYNFAYMRTQDCRPLKTKKHKKRPTGFLADTEATSSCIATPVGEATGGLFLLAAELGNRFPAPAESGGTDSAEAAASGSTGAAGKPIFSYF